MAEKTITLTIGEAQELTFAVTSAAYNQYINEIAMDNKVTPAVNFLKRTLVDKLQMPILDDYRDYAIELTAMLIKEFRPDLEFEVKK